MPSSGVTIIGAKGLPAPARVTGSIRVRYVVAQRSIFGRIATEFGVLNNLALIR
jgi:uncharacterized membrane protein